MRLAAFAKICRRCLTHRLQGFYNRFTDCVRFKGALQAQCTQLLGGPRVPPAHHPNWPPVATGRHRQADRKHIMCGPPRTFQRLPICVLQSCQLPGWHLHHRQCPQTL
eukprot:330969-Chlamydomonas_euryale.AAC.2